MDNEQRKVEIFKLIDEKQIRFTYYIIGLCVAAIGFSISQTANDSLMWYHSFLLVAILNWSFAIHSGFKYSDRSITLMKHNYNILKGHNPETVSENSKANKNFKRMRWGLYLGIIFFIIWQIFRMHYNHQIVLKDVI